MKKTISINISGILFHIEEDGYTTLKKYLESINRHFSHYEDNQEIISDIENRIAEIFLSNLKNNKQVITAENVNSLIEKMGTIADFKAIEEELDDSPEDKKAEANEEYDYYKHITPHENTKGYKKLTRLENRKILGGVCAGMANYLSIDPLWTRLVAILLIFSGNLKLGSPGWDFLPWNFNFSLSFGFFATIWASSSGMSGIIRQLNKIYDVKEERPLWKSIGVALLMTIIFIPSIILAMSLIALGKNVLEGLAYFLGYQNSVPLVFEFVRIGIAIIFLLIALSYIYYYAPNLKQKFKN